MKDFNILRSMGLLLEMKAKAEEIEEIMNMVETMSKSQGMEYNFNNLDVSEKLTLCEEIIAKIDGMIAELKDF
jgi:hypothetical protein